MLPMSISPPRKPEKGTYHHGNLRQALLEAARGLVAEAGLDGFGLREVSRRAGVSHAAVYNHFANRSALVEALAIEAFAAFTAALRAAERTTDDPLLRLERVGIAYVRFAFEHQAEFRFMFRPELCRDPHVEGEGGPLALAARESYAPLEETIAACERLDRVQIEGAFAERPIDDQRCEAVDARPRGQRDRLCVAANRAGCQTRGDRLFEWRVRFARGEGGPLALDMRIPAEFGPEHETELRLVFEGEAHVGDPDALEA
jgi:AcrR family transcriptional regulator